MADDDIQGRIRSLVAREHRLREELAAGEITAEAEHAELARLELELDQCWDLLRQRRARREFGQPDDSTLRGPDVVERYQG